MDEKELTTAQRIFAAEIRLQTERPMIWALNKRPEFHINPEYINTLTDDELLSLLVAHIGVSTPAAPRYTWRHDSDEEGGTEVIVDNETGEDYELSWEPEMDRLLAVLNKVGRFDPPV